MKFKKIIIHKSKLPYTIRDNFIVTDIGGYCIKENKIIINILNITRFNNISCKYVIYINDERNGYDIFERGDLFITKELYNTKIIFDKDFIIVIYPDLSNILKK